ncbi:MAG TPA: polysaccharide deacetylase family protein [Anaerolineae bacterium]|nr:polysaccharide deacetylase family protein [Anaerolineae bacterium]
MVNVLDTLIARSLGPCPNRPLLALTTVLFPGRFIQRLYTTTPDRDVDWEGYEAAVTLSFDVDLPEDVEALPWLLDVLASYSLRASFACIGCWVEREPDVHQRIVDEGHEVINHTYSHPWNEVFNPRPFLSLTPEERREEIQRGHEVILRELGYEPVGFRAPHLALSPTIYPVLSEMGYRYSSSALARRTGVLPFRAADGIWEFPLTQCPRHPSSVFDTYHAFRSGSWLFKVRGEDEDRFFDSFVRLKSGVVVLELGGHRGSVRPRFEDAGESVYAVHGVRVAGAQQRVDEVCGAR